MPGNSSIDNNRKEEGRGKILTCFLMITALFWLLDTPGLFKSILHIDDWRSWDAIVIGLLSLFGLVLMWQWKKLGVYLLYAATILLLFMPPLLSSYYGLKPANIIEYMNLIFVTVVFTVLLYFLLRGKWHLFS